MREEVIKVYKFNELDDRAKQKAREWYTGCDYPHDDWWDWTYEDFGIICGIIGIELATTPVKLMGGGVRHKPDINFSGFYSQGDGACFSGTYRGEPDALKFWDNLYPIKQDLLQHRVCLSCHTMQNEIQSYAIKLTQAAEQRMYRQQIAKWLLDSRSGSTDGSTARLMVLRSKDLPKPQWEYMKHNWMVNVGGYSRYKVREWVNTIMANPGAHTPPSMGCAQSLDEFLKKNFDLKNDDVVMIDDTKEGT
jgi:hypothetical protein